MSEMALTEWLRSNQTRAVLAYLQGRQAVTLRAFLAGHPVDPVKQGQAAAFHEIEQLLSAPVDTVREELEKAVKGHMA